MRTGPGSYVVRNLHWSFSDGSLQKKRVNLNLFLNFSVYLCLNIHLSIYFSIYLKILVTIYHLLFSCEAVSDSLWPHGLQHARLPCPSSTPRACLNSCPLSQWCHPTISFSVITFSSCLQSFPESGSFLMSQFFTSGGWSIRASSSASVLPMNIQDWFPLGLTGLISFQSKGLWRVFFNTAF